MTPNIDQFYKIISKRGGLVVDVPGTADGAIMVQWPWHGEDNQRWMFVRLNNDYYAIICKLSGKVVDGAGSNQGAQLSQWPWHGGDNQQWFLQDLGDGFQKIISKRSGLVVDGAGSNQGAQLSQWPWHGGDNQRWGPQAVEPLNLPSIETHPVPDLPQYESINDIPPDTSPKVVTNYTLAPFIAVDDPYYSNEQQQIKDNPYYLYVRRQYWQRIASDRLSPGESVTYNVTSGMSEADQNVVSTTVGHTIGADVGFQFGKENKRHASASLSYQYTTELATYESSTTTQLTETTVTRQWSNPNTYEMAVSKYILVSEYTLERPDGTLVRDRWIVKDGRDVATSSYPQGAKVIDYPVAIELVGAKQAVYNLFADAKHSTLKIDTTDYMIDQAARQVEQLSDEEYALEKMQLFNLVRCAKRLSKERNLLHYGDFESPNWRNQKDGWQASYDVTVLSNNPVFKGNYVNMPGATAGNGNITPTYLYQKVSESKLKPYTRYLVRGFVGSSKELELFVTRYGKEVHSKMNIPTYPKNTCEQTYGIPNAYGMKQVSDYTLSSDPCQLTYMPPAKEVCEDKQHFVFHIDVGEIYPRADLGIGVGFKISSPSGMAQLNNIEVIEANPLTGEALARVKKREKKWKREMEQQCVQTEKAVSAATQAVKSLFTDAQKNRLKATTTVQDIRSAEAKVKAIPYVYNPYFEEVPGMNDTIFQALQSDVYKASSLYQIRNLIRNGDFSSGLSNWHATAGAGVQERDGKPHVLVISQWDANVSQDVCVQPERGYVLRVTARKEGFGKGYVTLTDCTAENTETVTFTSDDMVPTPRPPVRPEHPVEPGVGDMTRYSESFGIVPETNMMVNEQPERYGTGACACGCGKPSTSYQAQTYSPPNMNGFSSNYITKTIEIFPETNRLRIDIGETDGTFLVESIELICMED